MSQDKPGRHLLTLLQHARERANWQPGKPKAPCTDHGSWRFPPDHDACPGCGCECHRPTDRDRELWIRIADEIDGYLAAPSDEGALF